MSLPTSLSAPGACAPTGAPARPSQPPAGTHPAGAAGTGPHRSRGPGRPTRPTLRALAADFVRLFLEVEAGRRPTDHLLPLMDPLLYAALEGRWVRRGPAGQLVRVTGVLTAPDCYDAVAVVRRGERYGAIALRLLRRRGSWRVSDANRPEDGPLPAPAVPPPEEGLDAFDLVLGLFAAARAAHDNRSTFSPS